MNIESQTRGEYTIKKYSSTGEIIQTVGPFDNLITNSGLDAIGQGGGRYSQYAMVGTGTVTPAVTDTELSAFKAATQLTQDTSSSNSGAPDYIGQYSRTFRFTPGQATGNLTEVGVGYLESVPPDMYYYRTCSRALITDSSGNPVTITVLSDEYLDVTYTLYLYPPKTDYLSSVDISGVTYNYTVRCSQIQNTSVYTLASDGQHILGIAGYTTAGTPLTLGALTANAPEGYTGYMPMSSQINTPVAYILGSYKAVTNSVIGLNENPAAGHTIRGLTFNVTGILSVRYQMILNPGIPKTATKKLTLNMSHTWARR